MSCGQLTQDLFSRATTVDAGGIELSVAVGVKELEERLYVLGAIDADDGEIVRGLDTKRHGTEYDAGETGAGRHYVGCVDGRRGVEREEKKEKKDVFLPPFIGPQTHGFKVAQGSKKERVVSVASETS